MKHLPKQAPFAETAHGMSTIEHLIPAAMKLEKQGDLDLKIFIQSVTSGPEKVLGRSASVIEAGAGANLCLFSQTDRAKVSAQTMLSEGKNSPLINQEVQGKVVATIHRGKLIYRSK